MGYILHPRNPDNGELSNFGYGLLVFGASSECTMYCLNCCEIASPTSLGRSVEIRWEIQAGL
jgi:hypothetical protein